MPSRFSPVSVLYIACLWAAILPAFSCSAKYAVALRQDGSADVSLSASLEPQTARLAANLAGLAGDAEPAAPLLAADLLAASFRAASGVASASLRNPDGRSVAGTVRVSDLDRFLSAPVADGLPDSSLPAARFIRLERSASGGRISLSLDRVSGAALLANLSPDIADYVSALLAPVATGEDLGKADYLALVESMYGKGIAAEIAAATVRASAELPGEVVAVRGGKAEGRRVDFALPLVDLLVLEKPILLEARWK